MGTKGTAVGTVRVIHVTVVLLCLCAIGSGQVTRTWNIPGTGSWHEPNNWDPNTGFPTIYDTAIVNQGTVYIRGDPASCHHLEIGSEVGTRGSVVMDVPGSSLSVSAYGTLYVGMAGYGAFTQ